MDISADTAPQRRRRRRVDRYVRDEPLSSLAIAESYPVAASLVAGALGLFIGSGRSGRFATEWL